MLAVLIIAAALWFGGGFLGLPRGLRAGLVAVMYLALVGLHLVFPATHPLRLATGGSAAPWLLLGGFVALVMLYRQGLATLRARATPREPAAPQTSGRFSDSELSRYARHIVLREVGGAGQKALKNAKVLVVGAGGLGAPALQYLAAAGVGTIGVIDDDTVDLQSEPVGGGTRGYDPKPHACSARTDVEESPIGFVIEADQSDAVELEALCPFDGFAQDRIL